jgi:hypothetical protein
MTSSDQLLIKMQRQETFVAIDKTIYCTVFLLVILLHVPPYLACVYLVPTGNPSR